MSITAVDKIESCALLIIYWILPIRYVYEIKINFVRLILVA
jgi:hypothetical protein